VLHRRLVIPSQRFARLGERHETVDYLAVFTFAKKRHRPDSQTHVSLSEAKNACSKV
jgi:hypothetical protein